MTELGKRYRDRITGFIGIATGRAEYLHQNPEIRIEADTKQEDAKNRWLAEDRLEPAPDDPPAGFSPPA